MKESVTEMMAQIDAIMALYQQEVGVRGRFNGQLGWVFEKGLNTADPKSILFSPDELLALFETIHVDLNAMVVSFRAFHSQWEPTLGSLEKSGRFLPCE